MQAARGTPLTPSGPGDDDPREPHENDTPGLPPDEPALASGRSPRRLRMTLALVALAAYALDVTTKTLAMHHLAGREPIEIIGPVLRLTLVRNPGAAFSTGTSFTVALSLLAMAAVVAVLVLARRVGTVGWAVALGLLLGGVSGNLTDRMLRDPAPLRGHVVDFLQLPNWPVFNVADICINLAAALIIWQSWRGIPLRGRKPEADAEAAEA